MKKVEQWRWWLPRGKGRKPYLSRWHMTEEEARQRGATEREPTSYMVFAVGETSAERDLVRLSTDTSPGAASRLEHLKVMGRVMCLPVRRVKWLEDFDRPWRAGFPA